MWIVIESQARIVSLTDDSVKTGGPLSRASQAMPLLLISKTASGAFSASEVWHAGVILHDAYSAADA